MRTLFLQYVIPYQFWADILCTAMFLINRIPSRTLANTSPYHKLYNHQPNYQLLKTFGCLYFPCLTYKIPHKFAFYSAPCVFIRYSSSYIGYKCYDIRTTKFIISRHVIFDESQFPFHSSTTQVPKNTSPGTKLHSRLLIPTSTVVSKLPTNSSNPHPTTSTNISPFRTSQSQPLNIHPDKSLTPTTPSVPTPTTPIRTHPMITGGQTGTLKPKKILNLQHYLPFNTIPNSYKSALLQPQWYATM